MKPILVIRQTRGAIPPRAPRPLMKLLLFLSIKLYFLDIMGRDGRIGIMNAVSIIGAAQLKHGVLKDKTLRDMIAEVGNACLEDAGIDRKEAQALYLSNYNGNMFNLQNTMGAYAATSLGMQHAPTMRLEGACASGGLAVRQAFLSLASGIYDTVMVLGIEKMNPDPEMEGALDFQSAIASGVDYNYEGKYGIAGPNMFAFFANRHMYEYGTTREQMAYVSSKNKSHASLNPYAHKQRETSMEKILKAPVISSPFSTHEVSLVSDGAAALLLTTQEKAKSMKAKRVSILGSGHGGSSFTIAHRQSFTEMPATINAANEAFAMASQGMNGGEIKREDIDVLECHDCFSFTEILNIEDLGFVKKGQGGAFSQEGNTKLGGKLPVNTSGGLTAKGHPIGCTGVGQVAEMTFQLRDEAEQRQVKDAKHALTHVLGGPGAVSAVHILQREE